MGKIFSECSRPRTGERSNRRSLFLFVLVRYKMAKYFICLIDQLFFYVKNVMFASTSHYNLHGSNSVFPLYFYNISNRNPPLRQLIEQHNISVPAMKILSKDKQQIFADLLKEYSSAVILSLVKLHNKLMKCLKHNKKTLLMKGEDADCRQFLLLFCLHV